MKEHTYEYRFSKVALNSIPIWFCLTVQIGLSVSFVFEKASITTLILANLFFSILSIPGLILQINYLKHTRNAKLIVRYNTISFTKGTEEITLNTFDIQKVILHEGLRSSRFPWFGFSWFELIDAEGESIKVSHYLLSIEDFWQDSLSRRVNSNNLVREESLVPMMK